jgi:hypothetical protein
MITTRLETNLSENGTVNFYVLIPKKVKGNIDLEYISG